MDNIEEFYDSVKQNMGLSPTNNWLTKNGRFFGA